MHAESMADQRRVVRWRHGQHLRCARSGVGRDRGHPATRRRETGHGSRGCRKPRPAGMGRAALRHARRTPAPRRRCHDGRTAGTGGGGDAGVRQAAHRSRGRGALRGGLPAQRGGAVAGPATGGVRRPSPRRACDRGAGACWRVRHDHAMELSDRHAGAQGCTGPGGGMHRGDEARRRDAAVSPGVRGIAAAGWCARRCVERCRRRRARHRCGVACGSTRAQALLHRQHRRGTTADARRGRTGDPLLDGAWWPCGVHRA